MKGNPLRKRYILIYSSESEISDSMVRKIASVTGSSRKFAEGKYAVVLTDQIRKEAVCSMIESGFPVITVVTVSGTINKCRKVMLKHKHKLQDIESLSDNVGLSG